MVVTSSLALGLWVYSGVQAAKYLNHFQIHFKILDKHPIMGIFRFIWKYKENSDSRLFHIY